MNEQERLGLQEISNLKTKKELLENGLQDALDQQYQQQINKFSYDHMIKRMNSDLLSIKAKIIDLENSLDYRFKLVLEEESLSRKTNEDQLQAKKELLKLMDLVDQEQKQRKKSIGELRKKIKSNEEAAEKRLERFQRRKDIADSAASDNNDQNELRLKSALLVNKLWSLFLKKKMEKDMAKVANYEKAFMKIKNSTGNDDIQEIVKKFLTREYTYSKHITSVKFFEEKLRKLKQENNELENQIEITNKVEKGGSNDNENEKEDMQKKLIHGLKESSFLDEKFHNCSKVYSRFKVWLEKIRLNMELQFNKIGEQEYSKFLSELNIEDIVGTTSNICTIIKEAAQKYLKLSKENKLCLSKYMNEFYTDNFFNKTRRIQPNKKELPSSKKEESITSSPHLGVEPSSTIPAGGEKFENESGNTELDKVNNELNFELKLARDKIQEASNKKVSFKVGTAGGSKKKERSDEKNSR